MHLTALGVNLMNEAIGKAYHQKKPKKRGMHMQQANLTEALYTIKNSIIALFYLKMVKGH